ncbi:MAG: carboxylating nicotinate-nucleotide diphosphorylase [Planctomycetota bacterium]|jgi:nicotinate-nucleotide pyrophosphorylase (carboxylating)
MATENNLKELRQSIARAISPPINASEFGDIEEYLEFIVSGALFEDIGPGDATTMLMIQSDAVGTGSFIARENGVLAGIQLAELVFRSVDEGIEIAPNLDEGGGFSAGDIIATIKGRLAGILPAERVALNFLQHLSGVATLTRKFVDAVEGTGAVIMDTRKTTPLYRLLEKYAVRMGGGKNHRFALHDAVFIKDNHITAAVRAGAVTRVIAINALMQRTRNNSKLPLIVEVENLEEALAAAEADVILLDNMPPDKIREAVAEFGKLENHGQIEASGGVNLENVREIAETGVDRISIGALTHSAKAADISLEIS